MTSFDTLALRPEIQAALRQLGHHTATPIQSQAIPHALQGRDVLGIAQTGTGKTAAFTLPILERLSKANPAVTPGLPLRAPRALILTPTRELAIQVAESIGNYGKGLKLAHTVIFGGVGQGAQVRALTDGLDIIVATPGRLLDLMSQGHVRLDKVEVLVLDEADRMLDMGFIQPLRKIMAKLPSQRQTLFFSATMPADVSELAAKMLRDPLRVEVTPVSTTAEKIQQQVIHVPSAEKRHVLVDLLRGDDAMDRIIAFTRTKHGANRVAAQLEQAGIAAAAIHGNKSQNARQAALDGFRAGSIRVLVATDIAARGIDVDGVSHVVNYELPNEPETYVHRIGRTARAGASGIAISLCGEGDERTYLRDIEKLIRKQIPVGARPAATAQVAALPDTRPAQPPRGQGRPGGRPGGQPRANAAPGNRQGAPARSGGARPDDHGKGQPGHARGAHAAGTGQPQRPARSQPAPRPQSGGAFSDFVAAINAGEDARPARQPQGQRPAQPQGQRPAQPQRAPRPQGQNRGQGHGHQGQGQGQNRGRRPGQS